MSCFIFLLALFPASLLSAHLSSREIGLSTLRSVLNACGLLNCPFFCIGECVANFPPKKTNDCLAKRLPLPTCCFMGSYVYFSCLGTSKSLFTGNDIIVKESWKKFEPSHCSCKRVVTSCKASIERLKQKSIFFKTFPYWWTIQLLTKLHKSLHNFLLYFFAMSINHVSGEPCIFKAASFPATTRKYINKQPSTHRKPTNFLL